MLATSQLCELLPISSLETTSELCELLPISPLETTFELDEFSRIGSSETDLTLSKYSDFKTVLVKFEVMFIPSSSLNLETDH